jgi:hypothetical protein
MVRLFVVVAFLILSPALLDILFRCNYPAIDGVSGSILVFPVASLA